MNGKKAYEQIIADQLETLPVPDMVDVIWARIEAQLDVELPPDNGPNGNYLSNFPTGGIFLGSISIIFVAVLYMLFTQTNNKTHTPVFMPTPPTPVTTLPDSSKPTGPTDLNKSVTNRSAVLFTTPPDASPQLPITDSNILFNPLVNIDSSHLPGSLALPTAVMPQVNDTTAGVKKGRGVTGLSSDDYRIVPKKDSFKKN